MKIEDPAQTDMGVPELLEIGARRAIGGEELPGLTDREGKAATLRGVLVRITGRWIE